MNVPRTRSCLIVGGGMSGLLAGTLLQNAGFSVQILDKGRGIGGRLATRRIDAPTGKAVFDYGAQYFTARSPEFKSFTETWLKQQIILEWSRGFYRESGGFKSTQESQYRGCISNRQVAKHLAESLNVVTSVRVTCMEYRDHSWRVQTESGAQFCADILLLTAPVPQSLDLLTRSSIDLDAAVRDQLQSVRYEPCFALLAVLDSESAVPDPGGIWMDGEPLAWIADNSMKGISPDAYAVTLHAGPQYSQERFDTDLNIIIRDMSDAARAWVGSNIIRTQLHRWKFAKPAVTFGAPCLFSDRSGPLVMAGDSFGGTRVEGAAVSGIQAAKAILEWNAA